MKGINSKCHLCGNQDILLKKSHIIPNYLYKEIADDSNKTIYIKFLDNRKDNCFTGAFEGNILCKKCDNELISSLENYAKNTLFSNAWHKKENIKFRKISYDRGVTTMRFENLDYKNIKLFFLSMLWRASLSNHALFNEINLGPHFDIIKNMILKNDPKNDEIYETGLCIIDNSLERPVRSMFQSRKISLEGNTWYLIQSGKYFFHFNVSVNNKQILFDRLKIHENGQMDICLLSNDIGLTYFDAFTGYPKIMQ